MIIWAPFPPSAPNLLFRCAAKRISAQIGVVRFYDFNISKFMRSQGFSIFLLFAVLFISGCENNRIQMISEKSHLKLPDQYAIIKNETKNLGGSDFEVNIILKFDEKNFSRILKQTNILVKVNKNWKLVDENYYYSNGSQTEPEKIQIDIGRKILYFNYIHI